MALNYKTVTKTVNVPDSVTITLSLKSAVLLRGFLAAVVPAESGGLWHELTPQLAGLPWYFKTWGWHALRLSGKVEAEAEELAAKFAAAEERPLVPS